MLESMKKICIVGLGYIGLPTALLLTEYDIEVIGVDTNEKVVNNLNKGLVHIKENGLEKKLISALKNKLFKAQTKYTTADIFLITVPTPIKDNNELLKTPNIDFVIDAINSIAPFYKEGNLIILESTSPVGTSKKLIDILHEKTKLNIEKILFTYCPERVIPGNTFNELINNNRVIGSNNKEAREKAESFYKIFCKGNISLTSPETAELVKLAENSFRDVNIAFANEISIICSSIGIDVKELIKLANNHPRVNILNPGCGVGGHCIALDPWFIVHSFPEMSRLIKTSREINEMKPIWVSEFILQRAKSINSNKKIKIGFLGISYKPNTADLRESPAIKIVNNIISKGYEVVVCEPNIDSHDIFDLSTVNKLLQNCELIVKLVGHDEFKKIGKNEKILDFS